jgi:hypothetical protein
MSKIVVEKSQKVVIFLLVLHFLEKKVTNVSWEHFMIDLES